MPKNAVAFLCFFFILGIAASAQDQKPATPDVSGVWEFTMQSPMGEMTSDATFVQTKVEEKFVIKFSMPGPMGSEMKGEGTIAGDALEWTVTINTPNGDFQLLFKGKVEGDKMSGDVQMGDFGASAWTAKKKKA